MTAKRLPRLLTALAFLLCLGPRPAPAQQETFSVGERVQIEQSVLDRWDRVSRMAVGPRARAFIDEGARVLERYRELLALEEEVEGGSSR